MQTLLSFSHGNAKLGPSIYTFSLPAGHTCPGALHCLASADRATGRVSDGPAQQYRCFSATDEARHPSVRNSRWRNFELLKAARTREGMAALITQSVPRKATVVRIHVGGDFFSEAYFLAWTDAARARPECRFYAYTKSLHLWRRLREFVPDNLVLTASLGGRFDSHAQGLKTAQVVFSPEQAEALGLEIDHDDSHAYEGTESFALLLHGTQAAGTPASGALKRLRSAGFTGYSMQNRQSN